MNYFYHQIPKKIFEITFQINNSSNLMLLVLVNIQ
jgi:hypothetical protein